MNLPNALTLSRLLSIPLLMWLLAARFTGHDQATAALFLVFSLTDTLDGNLARMRGQVTELGKFLDPLADKLFVLSVLISLVQEALVPAWVVVLIFSREILITILRSVGAGRGRVVAATAWGKTKTLSQMLAIILLILQRPYPRLALPAALAIAAAAAFTIASGADYLWQFRFLLGMGGEAEPPVPVETAAQAEPDPSEPPPLIPNPIDPTAQRLVQRLEEEGLTLGLAESCTGGLVAALITSVPGSSTAFLGSIVSYSNQAKRDLLGVLETSLQVHGAVSDPVARAMAEGARERLGVDIAVSITGLAGPGADGTSKPVGLTHFAVATATGMRSVRHVFEGDRWGNRRAAAGIALELALEAIEARHPVEPSDHPLPA